MASEGAEIRRLILATRRSLVPPPFPPRRDLDFACLGSPAGDDSTIFHDAFWARQDRFACFVVRIGGGAQGRLGAHAFKALLRTALRSYPADRALALGLQAFAPWLPDAPVDAAVASLSTGTGEATFGTTGAATALRLTGGGPEPDGQSRPACGAVCWLSVGGARPPAIGHDGAGVEEASDLVHAAIAGTSGAAAAAIALKSLRGARGRTFVLANDVAEISPLLAEIEDHLLSEGVRPEVLSGLDVALDELLTNVVLYAYGDGRPHEIVIDARVEDAALRIEIRDDGMPFDPTAAATPPDLDADLEDRPLGGLGLHFVRTIFDAVVYDRSGGWNVLALTKALAGDPVPGLDGPGGRAEGRTTA